ncbi:unnamed protein product [Caenorhabditis brenneri]
MSTFFYCDCDTLQAMLVLYSEFRTTSVFLLLTGNLSFLGMFRILGSLTISAMLDIENRTLDSTEGGSVSGLLTKSAFNNLMNFGLIGNASNESDQQQQFASPVFSSGQTNKGGMADSWDFPQAFTRIQPR